MTCLRTQNIRKQNIHVELQVEDTPTIETETQTTNSEFSKQEFDKVNNATSEQKSQTDAINLIDDIDDNSFRNIDTEDIWMFDDYDTQAIKNISKEIIDAAEPIETITVADDNGDFNPTETISIEDDMNIPSDEGIAIDAPKKVKITEYKIITE